MITIKFLGGAKKSFPNETLEIEEFDVTLSVLIDLILTLKPPTTPELDFNNILIAINGIDSSALQGKSTIVKKNDLTYVLKNYFQNLYWNR